MLWFHLQLLCLSSCVSLSLAAPKYCKPIPGSPDWPAAKNWQALNKTVEGRLIAPVAPGSVCQPKSPLYNNASCTELTDNWGNSLWHAQNPFTSDYNDDTCLPSSLAPCSAAGYPVYVVNATKKEHVQAAVRFAHRTGVRLILKGTGHDWPARSAGPNSLSIYTHNIRGITIDKKSVVAKNNGATAAVKIYAGMQMRDVYKAAANAKITIVGGADMNVGIGGWITNGGHSPISSVFGMGADQVLEMEVVTADGSFRVVNDKQYPELFWAMRGGGGSTYAVMVSVTVKAYARLPTVAYGFAFNTSAAGNTFWDMVGYFHTQLPSISEKGGMGYYWIFPNDPTASSPDFAAKLLGGFFFPNKTEQQVSSIMDPVATHIRAFQKEHEIKSQTFALPPVDFSTMWQTNGAESVGSDGRLGSYLLSNDSLLGNVTKLTNTLKAITPDGSVTLGHLVAGPGPRKAKPLGGSNGVLPAWRKAYTHVVLPRTWFYLNETAKDIVTKRLREVEIPALKALEPNSGAYVNEADPTNPDWKTDYWGGGAHYQRLLKIKQQWDPEGVFWCKPCVGHAMWEIKGGDGVGQAGVQLCRK